MYQKSNIASSHMLIMSRKFGLGIICSLLLLVSLVGVCMAAEEATEETPVYLTFIQGGVNSIADGENGMKVITVEDVIPYADFSADDENALVKIDTLSTLPVPLKAAVVSKGPDGKSVSMVEVSKISFSEGNEVLTLEATPLKFYEGDVLQSFASEQTELGTAGNTEKTGIYFEVTDTQLENLWGVDICVNLWFVSACI